MRIGIVIIMEIIIIVNYVGKNGHKLNREKGGEEKMTKNLRDYSCALMKSQCNYLILLLENKPPFSRKDMVKLTNCTLTSTSSYFYKLQKSGYLELATIYSNKSITRKGVT